MRCDYCQRVFNGNHLKGPAHTVACQRECLEALQHAASEEVLEHSSLHLSRPTPLSLVDAIRHGINIETGNSPEERCALAARVAPYVSDWLAQRFSAVMLRENDDRTVDMLFQLYTACTGRKLR